MNQTQTLFEKLHGMTREEFEKKQQEEKTIRLGYDDDDEEETTGIFFTKIANSWGIVSNRKLESGEEVNVTKKDGDTKRVRTGIAINIATFGRTDVFDYESGDKYYYFFDWLSSHDE